MRVGLRLMGDEDAFQQSKDTVSMIVVIPVIFIFIILTITLFSRFAVKSFDVREVHHPLLMQRAVLSSDCFSDGNEIYAEKFTSERFENCLKIKGRNIGIKATLEYDGKKKEIYDNILMTNRDFLCHGKNICSDERYFVLVNDNGIKKGWINIFVIELKNE